MISLSLLFTSSILFFSKGIPIMKTWASVVERGLFIFILWQVKLLNG